MKIYTYAILALATVVWFSPFLLIRRDGQLPSKVDRRARWGIALEVVSYSLLWQTHFWARVPQPWQIALSVLLLIAADALSWTGAIALGRQWRIDAGLNPDHELVRSGPYRLVRHPIYASMLCLVVGTGVLIAPLPLLLVSTVLFIVGTEIRVRVEDGLLEVRFGDVFRAYRDSVSAYIPFVR